MSLQPTPGTATEPPIENDGWWPNVDPAALRLACRLDGTVTPARLRHAAINAIVNVNTQLAVWKDAQIVAGHLALTEVPAQTVDDVSAKLTLYQRAVYAAVQAELIERYRDIDVTARGDKRAEDMSPRIDDARRDLRWAIADLQGLRRTTVELI